MHEDSCTQATLRILGWDSFPLRAMGLREAHVGQDAGLDAIHEFEELPELHASLNNPIKLERRLYYRYKFLPYCSLASCAVISN
jgi:hypothetical protein